MNFKIEFSDERFRLIIVSPSGEEDFLEAVLYCSVSSVVGPDGKVYGAYLNASDPELDRVEQAVEANPDEDFLSVPSSKVAVFDITSWPTLKAVPGPVTMIPTTFEDVESEDEEEGEEEGDTVDVEPIG